jgi:hypothetical protein
VSRTEHAVEQRRFHASRDHAHLRPRDEDFDPAQMTPPFSLFMARAPGERRSMR